VSYFYLLYISLSPVAPPPHLVLLSPVVPAVVSTISPLLSLSVEALLVAAARLRRRPPARRGRRPSPSSPRPAARVLLVRRLLRLSGPIPTVTSTATSVRLLLPGGDKQSLHVRNMRQRRRREKRRKKRRKRRRKKKE